MKSSRGTKLAGPEKTLFSGEYWTGRQALEYGLVDDVGDLRSVLRARFGAKVQTPLISAERGLFGRRTQGISGYGIGGHLGGDWAADFWNRPGLVDEILSAIEARAMWARFGL